MKTLLALLLISLAFRLSSQVKPEIIQLQDVAYPILTLKKSPSSNLLFMTLSGGRFILYDISTGRLNANSTPLWKNFSINGFELGGDAEFSTDEKYILVQEQYSMANRDKVQVQSIRVALMEAASGKIIYEADGINQAQILNDSQTLLLVTDDGVATFNFVSKQPGNIRTVENCEIGCLNHAGNILAVSYDPDREEFKKKHGAGYNKKEVKNAVKTKKLIGFYSFPSMERIGNIAEEVDVVFNMHFSQDDKYLIFFSRTKQLEHQHANVLNGLDKTQDLSQFQRIDMQDYRVDNANFIYQTSEALSNADLDLNSGLFVYGDNRGLLAGKREVVVVNFNQQQDYLAKYTYQGRSMTRVLFSTAFSILDENTILVANGLKLSYWKFRVNPNYSELVEPVDANALLDKAIAQLDADLESSESSLSKSIAKKQIKGMYLLTISVQKNGEVVSVFTQSDEKTNISHQNMLKDLIMKYKFDLSVPKNERIKFTYTFNL